ncbi:sensor histidine kinase [Paenibacillus sp. JJ-223]|uniref:sensor histidine kinase n=1 Tax=Paenibacillus sp. JJ-223 TaxID=2905647 RepID=UPI001F3309D9|nr:sensor histidine kinase [Paenibacillus sp. JJ-223]CAH1220808.1 Adaptive-response sensory-kinase SasA [Paenibacillus sp. JJ-223]
MIWVVCGFSTVLVLVVAILATKLHQRSRQLTYIHDKVASILNEGSYERVLLFSSDPQIRQILTDVNLLLDHAHRTGARYANQEKEIRHMLSNISHDLKTPLTVVLGYSETLLHRTELTEAERAAMTAKLHDKTQEVLRLILSFFNLAKLESGDVELTMDRVNASELCRLKVLSFYELLTNLEMQVELSIPDEDVFVRANEEALERVLDNLVTNAMKYGADGKVLGLSVDKQENGTVVISVRDQGRGIPEREHDHVFERMYTLEDSRNRLYQGSGLGLTITKRLVERMGGSIGLHSVPHEETVFSVCLQGG